MAGHAALARCARWQDIAWRAGWQRQQAAAAKGRQQWGRRCQRKRQAAADVAYGVSILILILKNGRVFLTGLLIMCKLSVCRFLLESAFPDRALPL